MTVTRARLKKMTNKIAAKVNDCDQVEYQLSIALAHFWAMRLMNNGSCIPEDGASDPDRAHSVLKGVFHSFIRHSLQMDHQTHNHTILLIYERCRIFNSERSFI